MRFWKRGKKRKDRVKNRDSNPRLVLIRQIILGIFLAILITGLGTGIWYGTRVEALTISEIEIIGGETIDYAILNKIAEEELSGTYYKLVPKSFAWTYPEKSIEKRITEVDRVKNVQVGRTSGSKLVIIFEEYRPFALWCEEPESKECLFLDREGYSFSEAPKLEGAAFLRFSEEGRKPKRSVQGFEGAYIRETENFIKKAYDDLGLNIIHVERTGNDEITYHISGGGELKVSLRMSNEETLDNLATILNSEEFQHIRPGNFQYIDLRYGNKIFVNEEEPVVEVMSTSTASSTVE